MAVCAFCNREMTTGVSCTADALHQRGAARPLAPARERCGDCGVSRGMLHHPGCDLQRCPSCGRQLISCGCAFDEEGFGGEWDDDEDHEDDELDDQLDEIDVADLAAAMRAIDEMFGR